MNYVHTLGEGEGRTEKGRKKITSSKARFEIVTMSNRVLFQLAFGRHIVVWVELPLMLSMA